MDEVVAGGFSVGTKQEYTTWITFIGKWLKTLPANIPDGDRNFPAVCLNLYPRSDYPKDDFF